MRILFAIAITFAACLGGFLRIFAAAPIPDEPFWQDVAARIRLTPPLEGAVFKKVCVDRENTVYVLTDRGVARVYDDVLALDRSFRPLAGRVPIDLAVSGEGDLFYLFDTEWLSNARNGRIRQEIPAGSFTRLAVRADGEIEPVNQPQPPLAPKPGAPWPELTCAVTVPGGTWFGSTRGAFFERTDGSSRYAIPTAPGLEPQRFRYYAGPRWLRDDHVVDLAVDRDGHVWALTRTGLNQIAFRTMTFADKADWFQRKIRSRNIRFGLTAERRLTTPGDIASSEMIDTDNDGGWTSYYLGALAAQYAVTSSPEVRRQAWDAFGALERLREISTVPGFFARTIERTGFKFSDVDRWRPAADSSWEWKGHTSSDEMAAQTFAHAVMWELVATNEMEKARIARNFLPIVDHILTNNLHLVDIDGKPTLWARWHPEYVNWYPPTIVDRRLNSAEIIASLQLAYAMSNAPKYREKADQLFQRHGYLTNIVSPMKLISFTPGYLHFGNDMGNEWNHSDDELAFFTYWVLVRFAFDADLRRQYLAAVADHWNFERPERYPIFNFLYAACGGADFDPAGAVWSLRGAPMDTINWPVRNSHRGDVVKREPNFMKREYEELLPPGERLMARINTQPFILDAGDGSVEFPGDEYLLGYWLGRYVGAIGAPARPLGR